MPHARANLEAEISKAIIRFEKEYMGRGPGETKTYIFEDMILVRLRGDNRTPLFKRLHCLVCDFGLAAVNIEGSATGRGGTPGYWAPELIPIDGVYGVCA